MHYEQYCKSQGLHQATPLSLYDFYQDLHRIALKRHNVLVGMKELKSPDQSRLYEFVARGLELILSGFGLLVCGIPIAVIAIAIKIDSPGPIFYRQTRVGKKGYVFRMVKFRTMFIDAESKTGPVWAVKGDPRQTRVGAFLRRTRLDELPQLINILKGEMTFVGPRPERPEFVYWFVQYIPSFDLRHNVKPGVAGLAQLKNGYDTSATDIYKKLRWDIEYIKRKSLWLNIWIILRTFIEMGRGKIR